MFSKIATKNLEYTEFLIFTFREYWEDEELTYNCANGELGLEASNNVTIKYSCVWGYPVGNYTTPKSEHEWPICMERTTTIKTRKLVSIDV